MPDGVSKGISNSVPNGLLIGLPNGFPDSLDMMLVCVEAGQSLDQSIVRVASEIRAGYPALADEFDIVAQEMKAGKDKHSVLEDMSERAGVQAV